MWIFNNDVQAGVISKETDRRRDVINYMNIINKDKKKKRICIDWLSGTTGGLYFHPEKYSIIRVTIDRSPVLRP